MTLDRDIIYMDSAMGISGDMFLGAMIDLGVDPELIEEAVYKLPIEPDEVSINTTRETRHSITATGFRVKAREGRHHRSFRAIRKMIMESALAEGVKEKSITIFELIAIAEAKVHGVPPEEVHFHEIGAMDSIVDIIGAAVAVEALGNPAFYSSPIALGTGMTKTMHGTIPIPAPATIEILKGVPVTPGPAPFELTTPTGAAIIKTLAEDFGPMPEMVVEAIGYGAGKKDFEGAANLLRAFRGKTRVGERASDKAQEGLIVLETNIDDMTPEIGGWLMERLFEAGALDVFYTQALMKKSRPGVLLTVLARREDKDSILEVIFTESTTIGVRTHGVERHCLERRTEKVSTPYGRVSIKVSSYRGQRVNAEPEYEDCRRLAIEKGLPLRVVMETARAAAMEGLNKRENKK